MNNTLVHQMMMRVEILQNSHLVSPIVQGTDPRSAVLDRITECRGIEERGALTLKASNG